MDIPVYLFTGFLESGKTTLIRDTLIDPEFTDREKTLLICCEEGMEEYDPMFLKRLNTSIEYVEEFSDITLEFYEKLQEKYHPDRVMIELNGTWNVREFLNVEMPQEWLLVQIISTVDASTFNLYVQNMKQMIFDQLNHSELIIFNRCDENTSKRFLRTNVKAINKGAQLIYEGKDGSINELSEEELPFDLDAPILEISDDDYGLWYMDALDHPFKYENKRVCIKGMAVSAVSDDANALILGRYAMVCCAEDTSLIGILVRDIDRSSLHENEWITVSGVLKVEFDVPTQQNFVVLHAENVEEANPMEDAYVYFS